MEDFSIKGMQADTKKEQILIVQNDIDHYNRQIADIDSRLIKLTNKKSSLAVKISKKAKYKSILTTEMYKENEY